MTTSDGRLLTADYRPLTLMEKVQVAIFEFLVRQDLPFVTNYHHPPILVEMRGNVLTVSLIDVQAGRGENIREFKRLKDSSSYILDRMGREV